MLQSDISNMVEECMRQVAQRNDTVRFVKLHNDDAEMEEEGVPAVLAYKVIYGALLASSLGPFLLRRALADAQSGKA